MTTGIGARVDHDKCQGHALCRALAPELFQLDDYGDARETMVGCIPAELIEKASVARANCPEEAIIIVEGKDLAGPLFRSFSVLTSGSSLVGSIVTMSWLASSQDTLW
jgi:ferredoxin